MTGNKQAHPLLISLANLNFDFRMKSSNRAFLLLALIPIPKVIHTASRMRSLLADRTFHECLAFVLEPLKQAAKCGVMMRDPLGWRRWCFTPLAGYIADAPEWSLVSGVSVAHSPVTMAKKSQFGDAFPHPTRLGSHTLASLKKIKAHPSNITKYQREALDDHGLTGVDRLFWATWPFADPSTFLTIEPLHQWHKFFWDHDIRWCINALGKQEIDYRFSILQPHIGYRHFNEGVSHVNQVTGREHRDIQRYLIGVIAGAVPSSFLLAVRALMDFRYLGQATHLSEDDLEKMTAYLALFHQHKNAIVDAQARRGGDKSASLNRVLTDWKIPKLSFKQSVTRNVRLNGVPAQWSADVTEHEHIVVVKNPIEHGNNRNHEAQICRYLDRAEKCSQFQLSAAMAEVGAEFGGDTMTDSQELLDNRGKDGGVGEGSTGTFSQTSDLLAALNPSTTARFAPSRQPTDYFSKSKAIFELASASAQNQTGIKMPRPIRTFSGKMTAFHLARDPSCARMSIEEVSMEFDIPDLHAALQHFLHGWSSKDHHVNTFGGRRHSSNNSVLPFSQLEIWKKFTLQTKSFHPPRKPCEPRTVSCLPPSTDWPHGRYDSVILNVDTSHEWPYSGLEGAFG